MVSGTPQTEGMSDSEKPPDTGSKATSLCGCGKFCMALFDPIEVEEHVDSVREMSKVEKELYVMGALYRINPDTARSRYGVRKRTRYDYRYADLRICRNAFIILYDVRESLLRILIKHVHTYGNNVPRVNKHKGKTSTRKLSIENMKNVAQYIKDYAAEHRLPIPADPRGGDVDTPIIYLPASTTKKKIHREYQRSCEEGRTSCSRILKYNTFCTIWRHFCSHVKMHDDF